jgi:hypothetical protein
MEFTYPSARSLTALRASRPGLGAASKPMEVPTSAPATNPLKNRPLFLLLIIISSLLSLKILLAG